MQTEFLMFNRSDRRCLSKVSCIYYWHSCSQMIHCRVTSSVLCLFCRYTWPEMKSKPAKSDANGSKSKVKKRAAEDSGTTLSKKVKEKKDGETSKPGVQPCEFSFTPVILCVRCSCHYNWMGLYFIIYFLSFAGPPFTCPVQKKNGHGSILHYIYRSTLGQSLHSQMRQVREMGLKWVASFPVKLPAYSRDYKVPGKSCYNMPRCKLGMFLWLKPVNPFFFFSNDHLCIIFKSIIHTACNWCYSVMLHEFQ